MRLIANSFLAMGMCIPLVLTNAQVPGERQPQLGSRGVPLITVDGLRFRDLNRDGKLEPYEGLAPPRAAESKRPGRPPVARREAKAHDARVGAC
jgi:hypothetical protein